MKHLLRAVSVLFLCLLCVPVFAQQPSVHDLAKAVDSHYNDLRSAEADFTESYRGAGMTRAESGRLWLKRPGKMRWEYQQPREKLFLSDGKTAWFYVPGERQARKAAVTRLDDLRSPLRFLLGKTRLEKEFEGLSLAPDIAPSKPGNYVLRGVPRTKSMAERVSMVLLEVTPLGQIERIVAEEVDGATTEFRFSAWRENLELADARFRFTPPPGVEMIEAGDLGQ
jgi:outer membrane lipoprotein carrier protein